MRYLWDLRLYSLPYGDRGVGAYTTSCARKLLESKGKDSVFALGSIRDIPDDLLCLMDGVISHQHSSWKKDLLSIPHLIRENNIDVVHYWVSAGPLHQIGMGARHRCKTIATVYDLGAQFWKGVPYLDHVRKTWYWRTQKFLLLRTTMLICDSNATVRDVARLNGSLAKKATILYPPPSPLRKTVPHRKPYFITLGGSPNKNLSHTLQAFKLLRNSHSEIRLKVLGHVDTEEEIHGDLPDGVDLVPMNTYEEHLANCTSMVVCSTHEGLGLPPLEAMSHACPLVLSDIAPFHETCERAACFVDPTQPESIAKGMEEVFTNTDKWIKRSSEGWKSYSIISDDSFDKLGNYWELFE